MSHVVVAPFNPDYEARGDEHFYLRIDTATLVGSEDSPRTVTVEILQAKGLKKMDRFGSSDPFVVVSVGKNKGRTMRTPVINNTLEPNWETAGVQPADYRFVFSAVSPSTPVRVQLFDHDRGSKDDPMGTRAIHSWERATTPAHPLATNT